MQNEFLTELGCWASSSRRRRRAVEGEAGAERDSVAEFALVLTDILLMRLAVDPDSAWSRCALEETPDAAILRITAFAPEALGSAFARTAAELRRWGGAEGERFMLDAGVPPDDAQVLAQAVPALCAHLEGRARGCAVEATYTTPAGGGDTGIGSSAEPREAWLGAESAHAVS